MSLTSSDVCQLHVDDSYRNILSPSPSPTPSPPLARCNSTVSISSSSDAEYRPQRVLEQSAPIEILELIDAIRVNEGPRSAVLYDA